MASIVKKAEKVALFNKGKRTWPLTVEGEKVSIGPQESKAVTKEQAEKLIKGYPREFMYLSDRKDVKKAAVLQKENDSLKAEKEALQKELDELKGAKDPK